MSDYLPQEVVINVLRRLPMKPLVRCTSVCKTWYTLITSPSFISTHLNQNKNNNNTHILLTHFTEKPEKAHYALHHDNENFNEYANFDDDFPFFTPNWYYRIVGSCNGLVCISDDEFTYRHCTILWNPCIKRWVCLPRPIFTFMTHGPFEHALGFGFDPVKNDYKVVRIVHLECDEIPTKVEIYRLSCGIWEDISHLELRYMVCEKYAQAYMNGAVHWVGKERHSFWGYRYFIVSFDISDEVFGKMELPYDAATDGRFNSRDLLVSNGSLFLVHWVYDSGFKTFDLWMMKEYGVAESWSKQFNVAMSGLRRPLGFRKDGEILWELDETLVSYDLESKQVKNLGISGCTSGLYWRSFHAETYVESLVLLDRRMDFAVCECIKENHESTKKKEENHEISSNILEVQEEAAIYSKCKKKNRGER